MYYFFIFFNKIYFYMLQVTSVQKSGLTVVASSFLSILKTQSDKLRHTLLKSKSTPSTKIRTKYTI
jgi:hypothetical protein